MPSYTKLGLPSKTTLGSWERLSEGKTYPEPPEDWTGTEPEWAINWALTKLKADFDFQHNVAGGRRFVGGIVADFVVYEPTEVMIQVQGVYWHYELGSEKQERDALQRAIVESKGWIVINIDEDDAMRDPIFYTEEALRHIDHSKTAYSR
jgi:very-short-patch-repair endonuclease